MTRLRTTSVGSNLYFFSHFLCFLRIWWAVLPWIGSYEDDPHSRCQSRLLLAQ